MALPNLSRSAATIAVTLPLALLAFPADAWAVDVGLRVEPGLAIPLTTPQTQHFKLGGAIGIKGYLGLGRYFDAQAGITYLRLGGAPGEQAGSAWSDSLGLRLHRPRDASPERGGFYAASPWIDGDALYVRTGELERFGVTAGAGVSFPLDERRHVWLGPFVRFMQIVSSPRPGVDTTDARVLFVGLNFDLGTSPLPRPVEVVYEPAPVVPCPECAPCVATVCPPAYVPPPDRDNDGVPDATDLCPDVAGPVTNQGCPVYKRVIIRETRMELKEKIMFAFDKAIILPKSHSLLDEVVQALKDNRGFRVQIAGHTDIVGTVGHNQALSEARAAAVLAYLVSHGVNPGRLSSQGFASTQPLETNDTVAGREANRRVEFVVQARNMEGSVK